MTLELPLTCPTGKGLECTLANTPELRRMVFRMRHECYLRGGFIDPIPGCEFSDHFDHEPNHFSYLLRAGGERPLATVRISVVAQNRGWLDSPAGHVFGDNQKFQAMKQDSYVEASRLCFGSLARRDLLVKLLGNMAALAEFYRVGWLVACPRAEHAPIYERLFGFQPMAAPRQYFGVNFKTQLLGVRREQHQEYVRFNRPMQAAWTEAYENLKRNKS